MEITGFRTLENGEYKLFELAAIAENDVLRYDSIAILIEPLKNRNKSAASIPGSAFACSPQEYYDRVTDIRIYSDQAYNSNFPAGVDLSSLFSVREFYDVEGISIDEFISYGWLYEGVYWTFTLLEAPDGAGTFDFTFVYSTDRDIDFDVTVTATIRRTNKCGMGGVT